MNTLVTGNVEDTREVSVELVTMGVLIADTVDVTVEIEDVLTVETILAVVADTFPCSYC